MSDAYFINFLREKGVEPTKKDIDALNRIANFSPAFEVAREKLDKIQDLVYYEDSDLARKIYRICVDPPKEQEQ